MRRAQWFLAGTMCLFLLSAVPWSHADKHSPKETLQAVIERVVAIVSDPGLSDAVLRDKLRPVIAPHVDFDEMARRMFGRHLERNRSRTAEAIAVCREFFEWVAVKRLWIDSARSGIQVAYLREEIDGALAAVDAKVTTPKGSEAAVTFLFHRSGGQWKVYDVTIEGVGLVANYRTQFNKVIAKTSFDGLLRQLREKTQAAKTAAQ